MPSLKVLNCYDFFVLTDVNLALLSLKKRLPHVTINEKMITIAENGSYKNGTLLCLYLPNLVTVSL